MQLVLRGAQQPRLVEQHPQLRGGGGGQLQLFDALVRRGQVPLHLRNNARLPFRCPGCLRCLRILKVVRRMALSRYGHEVGCSGPR